MSISEAERRMWGLPSEETVAKYEELYNTRIEWCCKGRHGVIRNVTRGEWNEIISMLEYYFGHGCYWNTKVLDRKTGARDVEFNHQTKVYPPPKKPWQWCGKTVLFDDWKKQEERQYELAQTFNLGEKVSFVHKGRKYIGLICGIGKNISILCGSEKWSCPPGDLTKET